MAESRSSFAGRLRMETSQAARIKRENNRLRLDDRHRHLLNRVADFFDQEPDEVEDAMLETESLDLMDDFFREGGTQRLIFHYQESRHHRSKSIRPQPVRFQSANTRPQKRPKLFVTDGTSERVDGMCALFMRCSRDRAITLENIGAEVNMMQLDCSNGGGAIAGVEQLLTSVLLPQLRALKGGGGWGQLEGDEHELTRSRFINSLEDFVTVLNGARDTMESKVKLAPCPEPLASQLKSTQALPSVAANAELLAEVEAVAHGWMVHIDHVMTESEQILRVKDDVGPRSELDYWKRRLAKYYSLLDELKNRQVTQVLAVLHLAKSKVKEKWQAMDREVTDNANEAKDNVRFLYTLDEHCMPLYHSDPVKMVAMIPRLINGIRMINSVSRFYNTSESLTPLFFKVTNQMITACKTYITNNGKETIWKRPREAVVAKLMDCIRLNEEYQACFQSTKKMLEQIPNEKKFELSEVYIFGKFDTFCRRLKKIIDMFRIIEIFDSLQDSNIEGIEECKKSYKSIVDTMERRKYDFLDRRVMDFDKDYERFNQEIKELETRLKAFIDSEFDKATSTLRAVQILKRFEGLGIPSLGVEEKYFKILEIYSNELDTAVKIYNENKDDPPIARNMAPIAGKIYWARQLYQRIEGPMVLLQKIPRLLKTHEGKRLVKNYNKLAEALVAFEMLYHRIWTGQVQKAHDGFKAPLLSSHAETQRLQVNMNPEVLTLIRETELMSRLGMDIPLAAHNLRVHQSTIRRRYDELSTILDDYYQLLSTIPSEYQPLMGTRLGRLKQTLKPGLTELNWMSLGTDAYFGEVRAEMADLELLLSRAKDLREFRIDGLFHEMGHVPLCELPESESWTIEAFVERTQNLCQQGAQLLQVKSSNIEESVTELINMLVGEAPEAQSVQPSEVFHEDEPTAVKHRTKLELKAHLQEAATELRMLFNGKNVEALVKLTKSTLETLRRRINASNMIAFDKNASVERPIFQCFATLSIPNVILSPSVEEVQQVVNKAAHSIIGVSRNVLQWSNDWTLWPTENDQESLSSDSEEEEVDRTERMMVRSRAPSFAESVSASEISSYSAATSQSQQSRRLPRKQSAVEPPIEVQGSRAKSMHHLVSRNNDVAQEYSMMSSAVVVQKQDLIASLVKLSEFKNIWSANKQAALREFQQNFPKIFEYKQKILEFFEQEELVNSSNAAFECGPIVILTERFKVAVREELVEWRQIFGRALRLTYKSEVVKIFPQMEAINKVLARQVKDLDDIRKAMAALREIREKEVEIDTIIPIIEECYDLLEKWHLTVPKEESEQVDTLKYTWLQLKAKGIEMQNYLFSIQDSYKTDLIKDTQSFKVEAAEFFNDYETNGPMVSNLPPREASDRLIIFQN